MLDESGFLDRLDSVQVAVIGDVMLDCYLHGDVTRISPEAPVPVVRTISERHVPGGAANVAANLASLSVRVNLVGITGADAARDSLLSSLQEMGTVNCDGVIATTLRPTTRKLRILAGAHHVVRVDYEDSSPCDTSLETACIAAATRAIDSADAVVISDYGKGVCSDRFMAAVIAHARREGRHVLLDPKRRNLAAYRGASLLTPNRKELSEATGLPCETDEEAELAARKAQQVCGCDILLTRSEKGMSLFPLAGEPVHMPTVAREVFDVSGAGDTVVAVLAAGIGANCPAAEAMQFANHAAGIVVSKVGTATVTRDELLASIRNSDQVPVVQ